MHTRRATVTLAALIACAWAPASLHGAEPTWATLHRDNQRSGYTDEQIKGPYERKWFRDFHEELIATRVEAIVAEGKVFVPTLAGNLYALDVKTGETAWTFKAAGPIEHSPYYAGGRLYVGADEGFNRGRLVCLSAADGVPVWEYDAGAGISASPMVEGPTVYVGDRAGVFHAVDLKTGKRIWTYQAGGMILTPASASADGKQIVFGAEDMRVYCLSSDGPSAGSGQGKLLWQSAKLGGLSLRDHAPTIWQGLAIVRTNPAQSLHSAFGMQGGVFKKFHQSLPMEADDKVLYDQWGRYTMQWTARRAAAERKFVRDYLDAHLPEKTFYALQLADGKEPWTAPVAYWAGLHNTGTPPTFNPQTGVLYTWAAGSLESIGAGVPGGGIAVTTLDRATGDTTQLRISDKAGLGQPSDETAALSLMGNVLLNTHQGSILGVKLDDLSAAHLIRQRDSYGGIIGVAYNHTQAPAKDFYTGTYAGQRGGVLTCVANEWHGPDRGIVAIAGGRVFWISGSMVVCVAGPDAQKTASGGASPPPAIKLAKPIVVPGCNLAVAWAGTFDESMPVEPIPAEKLRAVVEGLPPVAPVAAGDKAVQARLDAQVTELADGGPWAPLSMMLGISGESVEFVRADEGMQIVALALPTMSAPARAKAVAWLDKEWQAGRPLTQRGYDPSGKRREPYTIGESMGKKAPRVAPGVESLYAVWAYAHYADRWDKVLARLSDIEALYGQSASKPFTFKHQGNQIDPNGDIKFVLNNASEDVNGQIAGAIGYIRILRKAGKGAEADRAYPRLSEMITARVHHEKADTCFIRQDTLGNHSGRLPRYLALTPEVGQVLRQFAGEALGRNVAALAEQLPDAYQAYGARIIGGENYVNPPHLARALFAARAYGSGADAKALSRVLDQPWGKADLYYIEKCAMLLRASAGAAKP